ncbi:hypothetical protein [Microbacterium paraoxydans]|uniref:Uncharacterized protein n=1 Tax=Microbacterium paraoxydans TaxID=199592 RepID=A0ABS5IKQ9_9MICO|nr:hypothetical protein [Microbacterium paraoxydans]MBS0023555.1 hypothetical protein [Microbacterium paraoxydans]
MTRLRPSTILAATSLGVLSLGLAAAAVQPPDVGRHVVARASEGQYGTTAHAAPLGTPFDIAADIAENADQWSSLFGGEIGVIAPQHDGSVLIQLVDGATSEISLEIDGVTIIVNARPASGGALPAPRVPAF